MNKIKLALIGLTLLLTASCGMFGPKPHVAYHRPDIKVPSDSKVIVFPVLNWQGETLEATSGLQTSVTSGWTNFYGAEKTIPAGEIVASAAKKVGFDLMGMVKAMDNISYLEQTLQKDKKFKKFVNILTEKLGNYDLAMTLSNGTEEKYEGGEQVRLHLGYFNTKTLRWKWITKIEDKKGIVGNWTASYNNLVSNSFKKAEEVHGATRSLASKK